MQGKLFRVVWCDAVKAWDCHVCVEYEGKKIHMLATTTWFWKNLSSDKRAIWQVTGGCDESCTAETIILPPWAADIVKGDKDAKRV